MYMVVQTLFKVRMVAGDQRGCRQRSGRYKHEKTCKTNEKANLGNAKNRVVQHGRKDLLIEIEVLACDQQNGNRFHNPDVLVEHLGKQENKRQEPVNKEIDIKNHFESAVPAMGEVFGFFRDISVPDQHELGESKIPPHNTKHEDIPGEIEHVTFVERFKMAFFMKEDHHEDHCCRTVEKCGDKILKRENGAEPVDIQRHDPVEGSE